jgi:prepilin-type N-terminal cleavage/methylation domain-containing protein
MRRGAERRTVARGPGRRAFSLLELLAVLVVISLAAGLVLPRLPSIGAVELHATAARLAERLSAAREQAILEGRAVHVDLHAGLPSGVRVASVDTGGTAVAPAGLTLEPDGDALPATATLIDDRGTRIAIVLPAGFMPARVMEMP